jgi:hypothetical protein
MYGEAHETGTSSVGHVVALCRGSWELGSACGKCSRCLGLAPAYIKVLEHYLRMYKTAWIRELGGKVFNKSHLIDALVKTTAIMRDELFAYKAAERRAIEQQQIDEYIHAKPSAVAYPIRIPNPKWN